MHHAETHEGMFNIRVESRGIVDDLLKCILGGIAGIVRDRSPVYLNYGPTSRSAGGSFRKKSLRRTGIGSVSGELGAVHVDRSPVECEGHGISL